MSAKKIIRFSGLVILVLVIIVIGYGAKGCRESGHSSVGSSGSVGSWTAITSVNAPQARANHIGVRINFQRVVIWGGRDGASYLDDGRIYNPLVHRWQTITAVGAPTERSRHTAVWTDSKIKMLVWGGYDGSDALDTGKVYEPVEPLPGDQWSVISSTNAPSARYDHTAVWTEEKMLIWGGYNDTDALNTGVRYDPIGNSWTSITTTNAPLSRSNHTAVWTGSKMLIWGGWDGAALGSGGAYNPDNNTWTSITMDGAPLSRSNHTAVWTDSKMLIWGGWDGSAPFNTGGAYDPDGKTWTSITTINAPLSRSNHTAIWTGGEGDEFYIKKMIIWGGKDADGNYLNTGAIYDPVEDTWKTMTIVNAPEGRENHTAVWIGPVTYAMIIWGGFNDTEGYLDTGGVYRPSE